MTPDTRTTERSKTCWDCGVPVGKPHGQTDYGRCDGYEERGGYFVRSAPATTTENRCAAVCGASEATHNFWKRTDPYHHDFRPDTRTTENPENIDETRAWVAEHLGPEWRITEVEQRMPVRIKVEFYAKPGTESDEDGTSWWRTGPHLTYSGEGRSIRDALDAAMGKAQKGEDDR